MNTRTASTSPAPVPPALAALRAHWARMAPREQSLVLAAAAVVGLADLVNFAEDMLVGSDVPKDFNVEAWVGDWLQVQQPALGGKAPAEFMATPSGRDTVRRLLSAIQSGSYQ